MLSDGDAIFAVPDMHDDMVCRHRINKQSCIIIIIIIIIITELLWRLLQNIVRPTAHYNMKVHKNG